jgi:hypothetical protein
MTVKHGEMDEMFMFMVMVMVMVMVITDLGATIQYDTLSHGRNEESRYATIQHVTMRLACTRMKRCAVDRHPIITLSMKHFLMCITSL